tara:strand:- start:164 stop:1291 length:1128 start_codon:yes stop_codon:yes gene_type:complete
MFVFGTRPEAIKLAPVIKLFQNDSKNFKSIVVVTAQHREMLDQVMTLFNINADYDLDVMERNQTLHGLTSKILTGVSDLLIKLAPDIVCVQGDTTTTFAASLAAYYQSIPLVHIEAGLRTNNIYSPFPEEVNRRITSSIATLHFPPTEESKNNLLKIGINKNNIAVSGNTVVDALLSASNNIDSSKINLKKILKKNYLIELSGNRIILVTGHRRESFGGGFDDICNAIKEIALKNQVDILYPVHLNPNVQSPVNRILGDVKNVHLIPPQDYIPFVIMMKNAFIILTDSGGIQEEAPSFGKPVIIMRDTTERPEGVKAGVAKLVGTNKEKIIHSVELLLNSNKEYRKMSSAVNPYGDGSASKVIFNYVLKYIKRNK